MNKDILRMAGLGKQVDAVENGTCPCCFKPIVPKDFKDNPSRKEFTISGMCQKCQDVTFV